MNMLRRILDKASKISDEVLFTSKQFERYLLLLVMGMSSRFRNPPKIRLYLGSPEETAATNNREIRANINSDIICKTDGRESTREEKVRGLRGTIAHEVGHIIYTPFKLSSMVKHIFMDERTLYPLNEYADVVENADDLLSYLENAAPKKAMAVYEMYQSEIDNVLEDEYVDDQITGGRYPLGKDRLFVLDKFAKTFPTFEKILESESNASCKELGELNTAFTLLFGYAKLHIVAKHEKKNENHPALQRLYEIAPEIDEIMGDDDPLQRTARIQKILCFYWPEIKAYMDTLPEDVESPEQPSNGDQDANAPTGDGGTGNSSQENSAKKPSNDQKQAIRKMLSEKPGDKNKDESSSNGEKQSGESSAVEQNKDNSKSEQQDGYGNEESQSKSGSASMDSSGKSRRNQNDTKGCQNDTPADSPDNNSTLSNAIESMLKNIAEEEVEKEDAEASAQEFQTFRSNTGFGLDTHFNQEPSEGGYGMIKDEVEAASKAIVRYFRQKIQAKNGYKMNGFYSGTKISMSAISSNNMALFEKKKLPGDVPKMAVAYLGDESGSMRGRKQRANMLAAEAIYTFCDALNIPIGVYGHSYSGRIELNIYSDFRKSNKDKYRITEIEGSGCNLDGYAIRLVAEKLLKQPGEYHVMIVTSDGLPSAYDSRQQGINDIKAAVKEYSRKGVSFIAAAMDEDKQTIQEIYGSSYIGISDPKEMPKKLVNSLAKYLV